MTDSRIDIESRLRAGDTAAAGELFAAHRDRLKKMVRLRLDRRLQGRLDASDVLQEAFLDVQKKAPDFAQKEMPAYLWLRLVVAERLLVMHRHHLVVQMRDAGREVPLYRDGFRAANSYSLANLLLGRFTTPTQAAARAEERAWLREALDGMDPLDREVLALRHFEELTNLETATVLGISKTAASNRYLRALKRLKEVLVAMPGMNPNATGG